jgi:hypothetical protein
MRRFTVSWVVLALAMTAVLGVGVVGAQDGSPDACPTTTEEENIALVQGYAEAVEAGDTAAIDAALADAYTHNQNRFGLPDDPASNQDEITLAMMLQALYPGSTASIDQILADGNTVVVATTRTITQHQLDPNAEPTTLAEPLAIRSIAILQIECGEIASANILTDELSLLIGIGVIPPLDLGGTPEA